MIPEHLSSFLPADFEERLQSAVSRSGMGMKTDPRFWHADRAGRVTIPIAPTNDPYSLYDFLEALAKTEMELRDAGFDITLSPVYDQKMIAVVRWNGQEYLFPTTASRLREDLAKNLHLSPASVDPDISFDGYAYDNSDEIAFVMKEARREHPTAVTFEKAS